jgi:hypothetical protein
MWRAQVLLLPQWQVLAQAQPLLACLMGPSAYICMEHLGLAQALQAQSSFVTRQ